MSRLFNRKSAAVATVIALIAAGGAYAYWTQSGSGAGTATTAADGAAITVNQDSAITNLSPASDAQALSGDFDNPNDGRVHIISVTATLDSIVGAPAGCTIADYQINNPTTTFSGTPQDLASGTNVGAWSGPSIEMLDRNQNQDGCKGATVNISYVTASA